MFDRALEGDRGRDATIDKADGSGSCSSDGTSYVEAVVGLHKQKGKAVVLLGQHELQTPFHLPIKPLESCQHDS